MKDQDENEREIEKVADELDGLRAALQGIRDDIRRILSREYEVERTEKRDPAGAAGYAGYAAGREWASTPGKEFPKISPYGATTDENAGWWEWFSIGADSVDEEGK